MLGNTRQTYTGKTSHSAYDTKTIRNLLEMEMNIIGSRTLRVIISEELYPISELRGEHFLGAFFEIQQWHYKVWNIGIHHTDPSLSSFMYRKEGEEHHALECTGTAPFMALDLLLNRQGQIQHLYRHAHEATIWIATWVFLCYANGRYVGNTHDPDLA
ncbi:hypothetical protein K474DRAFT_1670066, partial [Panus rudis PR-1116 ss-1]